MGNGIGVDFRIISVTFGLLERLREYDEMTAKECLQAMPLSLGLADEYSAFYGIEVDREALWAAALLHDIGKVGIPKEYIDRSNAGLTWSVEDSLVMSVHARVGETITQLMMLPPSITRPIAEHHHRQPFRRSCDAGIEPALAAFGKREALVEQHDVVPLRALRLVHGQHIAVIEFVVGLAALPIDLLDAAGETFRPH